MLSIFPELLSFSFFAPLILRIVLGATFFHFGFGHARQQNGDTRPLLWYGLLEIVLAFLLIIGLFVQIAAALISLILIAHIVRKITRKAFLTDGINYYVLLLAISLSLILLGAGAFAFDMPL